MSLDRDVQLLSKVATFADLASDEIKLLAFNAAHRTVRQGKILFAEGDVAASAVIVVSGSVRLLRNGEDGDIDEGDYGAGTIFGELALLTDTHRPATARALDDVELIEISRSVFRRILEEYPDKAVLLHARLAARLGAAIEEISAVGPRFSGNG